MLDRAIKRFWDRVQKGKNPNDCWTWLGVKNRKGYGVYLKHPIGEMFAHRISWTIHFGKIPKGLFVCHHCDNPQCANPDHLFVGTNRENILDSMRKGRLCRGERGYTSKLNEPKVREIHRLYIEEKLSSNKIAEMFGVTQPAILDVLSGKSWKHLNLPKVEIRGQKGGTFFAKLKEHDVRRIKEKLKLGYTKHYLAHEFKVRYAAIHLIAQNKTWKNVHAVM